MTTLTDILNTFDAVTLDEMDGVKLMNRVDTKYVMTEDILPVFLSACLDSYRVLVVDGSRISGYTSLYFDTADRSMYLRHLYGRKTRQKIRTRTYLSSGQTFLEIKRKNNHGRTKKKRIEIPGDEYYDFSKDPKAVGFLRDKSWFSAEELSPSLNVSFERITLVNRDMTERMTIDRALTFGDCKRLDGIAVVEVKQSGFTMTEARRTLHNLHVLPYRISKYCIGTVLTDSSLPHNRFNEKLRYIEKLQRLWKNSYNTMPK